MKNEKKERRNKFCIKNKRKYYKKEKLLWKIARVDENEWKHQKKKKNDDKRFLFLTIFFVSIARVERYQSLYTHTQTHVKKNK